MRKQLLHTFVICAYKESPYLDECIASLKNQSVKSEIIIVTHTPCDYISDMAAKYGLTLFVNEGEGGITQDWNFGLSKVKTRFATIAHQDDTYEPDYTRELLSRMRKCRKPLIAFADYYELRGEEKVDRTKMLNIKRFMLLPLRPWFAWKSKFIRRRILSFGDAICCPSVMYCLDNLEQPIFHNHFICCEDWEAWESSLAWKASSSMCQSPSCLTVFMRSPQPQRLWSRAAVSQKTWKCTRSSGLSGWQNSSTTSIQILKSLTT